MNEEALAERHFGKPVNSFADCTDLRLHDILDSEHTESTFRDYSGTYEKWLEENLCEQRNENASLTEKVGRFTLEVTLIRDRIGDRTHGAMLSECEEWYERLNALLKDGG